MALELRRSNAAGEQALTQNKHPSCIYSSVQGETANNWPCGSAAAKAYKCQAEKRPTDIRRDDQAGPPKCHAFIKPEFSGKLG